MLNTPAAPIMDFGHLSIAGEGAVLPRVALPDFVEVRWHGRGGQGVVTASEMLARAALEEGKHFQSFPEFSAERSGAPVAAYTRISNAPIDMYCAVTSPGVVVVLDPSLLGLVDVFAGLDCSGPSGGYTGLAVINSLEPASVLRARFGLWDCAVCAVNATRIASEVFGRPLVNGPVLGALVRATGLVGPDTIARTVHEHMGARLPAEARRSNVAALRMGYDKADILPPGCEFLESEIAEVLTYA